MADPGIVWDDEPPTTVAPAAATPGVVWDDQAPAAASQGLAWDANTGADVPDARSDQQQSEQGTTAEALTGGASGAYEVGLRRQKDAAQLAESFKATEPGTLTREAGVNRIAEQFGIKRSLIEPNLRQWQAAVRESEFNPDKLRADHPEVARMLLEHPEIHTVETVKELGFLTKTLRSIQDAVGDAERMNVITGGSSDKLTERLKALDPEKDAAARAARDAPKAVTEVDDATAAYVRAHPALAPFGRLDENWKQSHVAGLSAELALRLLANDDSQSDTSPDVFKETTNSKAIEDLRGQLLDAKLLAGQPRALGPGGDGFAADALTGAASSAYGLGSGFTKSGVLPDSPAVAATLIGAVGLAGLAAYRVPGGKYVLGAALARGTFNLELGSTFDQSTDWKDDNGNVLDERTRAAGSAAYALLATAQEFGELALLHGAGKAAGAVDAAALTGSGLKATFRNAMRSPEFRKLVGETAKAALGEQAEEAGQSLTQAMMTWLSKSLSQGSASQQGLNQKDAEDALQAFGQAGPYSLIQAVAGAAIGKAAAHRTLHDNLAGNAQAKEIATLDSEAARTAPAAVASLIEDASAKSGRPTTHLYVDPEVLATSRLFQDEKQASVEDLLGPDGQRKLDEALATGGKVEVEMPRYLEHWAGTPLAKETAEDTTVRAGGLTTRELKEHPELVTAQAAAYVEEAEVEKKKAAKEAERFRDMDAAVAAAGVKGLDKGKARASVNLWRAIDRQVRSYNPELADQIFEQSRFQLAGGGDLTESMLQAGKDPLTVRALNEDPVQRATDINIDPLTNGRNFEAWKSEPRQEGKQVNAVTLLIKPVNDNPGGGHDTSNALLRAASPVFAALDPEFARKGPTFLFHGDQASLVQALGQVRATLPEGFEVAGATGADTTPALDALDKHVAEARKSGALPALRTDTKFDLSKLPQVEQQLAASEAKTPHPVLPNLSPRMLEAAGKLTPEAMFRTYQDANTPRMLSPTGWNNIARKAFVASIDVKGLRAFMDGLIADPKNATEAERKTAREAGDQLLRFLEQQMMDHGGLTVDAAHLSGDEYAAQSDSKEDLQAWLDGVEAVLQLRRAYVTVGERVLLPFVAVRSAIGEKTYGAADRALNAAKAAEPTGGARAAVPGRDVLEARRARARGLGAAGQAFSDRQGTGQGGEAGAAEGARGRGPTWYEQTPQPAEAVAEVRGIIGRYQEVARRKWATDFLHFIIAGSKGVRPGSGGLSDEIRHGITLALSKLGFSDPEARFDANGQMVFPGTGIKTANQANAKGKGKSDLSSGEREAFQAQMRGDAPDARLRQGGDSPRGSVQHITDGVRDIFRIALNPNADLSTFLHESGHVFLEIFADLAQRPDAPEQVKVDFAEAQKFMGAAVGPATRNANGWSFTRAQHEKFADAFLIYLHEGKAPSQALASSFKKFSKWLMGIYKTVSELGAPLSPEIKGVFDRLLATEQEIADTKRNMGAPLIGSLADALALGLSPERYAEYLDDQEKATSHAERTAKLQGNKELLREKTAQWKAELAAHVKTAEAEFDALPAARAKSALLGEGSLASAAHQVLGGEDTLKVPLARAAVEAAVGAAAARKFRLVKEGGFSPDDVATGYGFDSGAEMLKAIEVLPSRREWAEKRGDFLMREANPGLLEDRANLAELVGKGLHGDETERWLLKEIDALTAKAPHGFAGKVPIESIRLAAETMVARTLVGKLSPGKALAAERKAANLAVKLLAKKDFDAVLVQKQKQLLNFHLWRLLQDAKDLTDAAERKISHTSDDVRANLGKADPAYRDVHDAIAQAVSIDSRFDAAGQLKPAGVGLERLLAAMAASGQEPSFDVETIRALLAKPTPWARLPFSQAQVVADAITNIRHLAYQENNIIIGGKAVAKLTYWKEVQDRAESVRKRVPAEPARKEDKSFSEKARAVARGASSVLQDIETITHMLDGGPEGPSRRLWVDSRRAGPRTVQARLTKEVMHKIRDLVASLPKETLARKDETMPELSKLLPELHDRFIARHKRSVLYTLFLNSGNEGNQQRLRDGNGWTDENRQKALDLLTPAEAKFLQGILDIVDSLGPELAKAYQARTGLVMGRVPASVITVNGEHFRGGYYPLRADSAKSAQGRAMEINDVKDLFPSNHAPVTAMGMAKERIATAAYPLDMSWSVLPAHLSQVIHTIAYDEWIRQTGRAILKPRVELNGFPSFSETASKFLGPERERELKKLLQDIACERSDSAASHTNQWLKAIGGFSSSVVARQAMSFNYPSLMRHMFDAWTPLADSESVHPTRIFSAYLQVWNPATWARPEFALSKSLEYHRVSHHDNLRQELQLLGTGTKLGELNAKALKVAFAAHEFVHSFTARVAFKAAYDQAIGQGKSIEDAVKRADDVVDRHFPNGDIAEKPPLLRTKYGLASMAMFYGYASKIHNVRSRSWDDVARAWSPPQGSTASQKADAVATGAGKYIALGAIGAIGMYLAAKGPKKDEDAEEWAGIEMLLSPLDDVWAVGPLVKAALTGHKINVASAPELDWLASMLGRVQKAMKHEDKAQEWGDADIVKTAVATLLTMLGASGAGDRTASGIAAVPDSSGPIDAAGKVFYGSRKNQSRNPINDLADLLQ